MKNMSVHKFVRNYKTKLVHEPALPFIFRCSRSLWFRVNKMKKTLYIFLLFYLQRLMDNASHLKNVKN